MSARQLIDAVAQSHGLTRDHILGTRRVPSVVRARQEAMWRLRVFLGLSYPEIGAVLKRDHSTVIYGVEEHERRMAARGNA